MNKRVKQVAVFIASASLLFLGACSNGDDMCTDFTLVPEEFAAGMISMTFVDTSRPTAAHGSVPEQSSRTLVTTLIYPAEGALGGDVAPNTPVEKSAGPFPLIVLSHGLGGNVEMRLYPGMDHTVNEDEIGFVSSILATLAPPTAQ